MAAAPPPAFEYSAGDALSGDYEAWCKGKSDSFTAGSACYYIETVSGYGSFRSSACATHGATPAVLDTTALISAAASLRKSSSRRIEREDTQSSCQQSRHRVFGSVFRPAETPATGVPGPGITTLPIIPAAFAPVNRRVTTSAARISLPRAASRPPLAQLGRCLSSSARSLSPLPPLLPLPNLRHHSRPPVLSDNHPTDGSWRLPPPSSATSPSDQGSPHYFHYFHYSRVHSASWTPSHFPRTAKDGDQKCKEVGGRLARMSSASRMDQVAANLNVSSTEVLPATRGQNLE